MATCGRIFFFFLAEIFTLACFALSIVAFFGCYKSGGLSDIYTMKVDLSNLRIYGATLQAALGTHYSSSLHQVYQIGIQGYCYGDYETGYSNSTLTIKNCVTPSVPNWFDLISILKENLPAQFYAVINIPTALSDYNTVVKSVNYATWALILLEFIFAFFAAVIGFLGSCFPAASSVAAGLSIFATLVGLAGAALSTGTWIVYSNKINDYASTFGANATLGGGGIAIMWIAAVCSLVAMFLWTFSACCGSSRRKY